VTASAVNDRKSAAKDKRDRGQGDQHADFHCGLATAGAPEASRPRNYHVSNEPRVTLAHLILRNLTIGKFEIVMHALVAATRTHPSIINWGCTRWVAMANQVRICACGINFWCGIIADAVRSRPSAFRVLLSSYVKDGACCSAPAWTSGGRWFAYQRFEVLL
jgi:hypothetical protein